MNSGRGATGHPERIVPDETVPGVVVLHEARYRFALPYCAGAEVLDAACGVGYGSALLAERARCVLGVDRSPEAIDYARRRYAASNVEFREMDVLALDLPDACFDVVCSFETIEHLSDPERFLREVERVLRPSGRFLVSTPNVAETTRSPANPFHAIELARADLEQLLRGVFPEVDLYGQRRLESSRHRLLRRLDVLGLRRRFGFLRRAAAPLTGSRPTEALTLADVTIEPGPSEGASELIAVCRRR